ncbi:hypothetical protein [Nocardia salmonicida]|uniref:hypothetical protein n=1 Tax=Nocardia salmonicida TaxID=53431 RepID=UPI0007A5581F|nr:hypothetical protein [Nocardia salmonicida]
MNLSQLSSAIEAAVAQHLNELGKAVGLLPLTWFVAPSVTSDDSMEAVLSVEGQAGSHLSQHPGRVVDQWANVLGLRRVLSPTPGVHAVEGLLEPQPGEYRFEIRIWGVVDPAVLHAQRDWGRWQG